MYPSKIYFVSTLFEVIVVALVLLNWYIGPVFFVFIFFTRAEKKEQEEQILFLLDENN